MLSTVDLPQPDGPTMVTMAPSGTEKVKSETATTGSRSRGRNTMPTSARRILAGVEAEARAMVASSGTGERRFPAQQARLELAHRQAEQPGHHCEHDQAREHTRGVEARGARGDQVAEPMVGGENLRDDHAEQRIGEAEVEPGEDPRQRRRERDLPENVALGGAHQPRDGENVVVHVLGAAERVHQQDEEHQRERGHDLGQHPDAEPEDDQRRQRHPGQAVERKDERRQHLVPERRARKQEPAEDAERGGDHEGDQGLVDGDGDIADERAALHEMPELLHDQGGRADPERIDEPDAYHQLPDTEDRADHRDAGEHHAAAVERAVARTFGRGRVDVGRDHGQWSAGLESSRGIRPCATTCVQDTGCAISLPANSIWLMLEMALGVATGLKFLRY